MGGNRKAAVLTLRDVKKMRKNNEPGEDPAAASIAATFRATLALGAAVWDGEPAALRACSDVGIDPRRDADMQRVVQLHVRQVQHARTRHIDIDGRRAGIALRCGDGCCCAKRKDHLAEHGDLPPTLLDIMMGRGERARGSRALHCSHAAHDGKRFGFGMDNSGERANNPAWN